MKVRTIALVPCTIVILCTLAGCSPPGSEKASLLDLKQAKAETLKIETQVANSIPTADVSSVHQQTEALTILACSGSEYRWPGLTTVTLADGAKPQQIIASLGPQWSDLRGWTVAHEHSLDGLPRLHLVAPDGADFYVTIVDKESAIQVGSLSACFPFPGGPKPGVHY